ncbi:hypothetical protein ABZT06_08600 [Streptomyces sp. NPDC005483]|uniref:hypothetical protein n=1 Tax=Streptomyces sp. NPDC005483 TaxID=3154882 RepID=UPI0033B831B1
MTAEPYPYRVRLWGGRNVHASRDVNGGPNRVTACGYYLPANSNNHGVTPIADIECSRCRTAINTARP